jgi:hypothetical protein
MLMKRRVHQIGNRRYALVVMSLGLLLLGACDALEPITVTISSPKDGDVYDVGEAITFSGQAVDRTEGELTGDALVWEASGEDEDIQIGTGNSFTRSDLPEGFYIIFLTATNSKDEIGMEAVSITIGNASPDDNETVAAIE